LRKGLFYDSSNNPFDIPIGSRFSLNDLNYVASENRAVGEYTLTCETAGAAGNQSFGDLIPITFITGLARVELSDVLDAGEDEETDDQLRQRVLTKARMPGASGNKANYVNWALEVAGVGGVSVVPVRDGPGTVSIAIINTSKAPADQTLVDTVQDYIAPPHELTYEAEVLTTGGSGSSLESGAVKLVYDVAGNGTIRQTIRSGSVAYILPQPGIWQIRVRVKADAAAGTDDLLRVGIWNDSTADWAQTKLVGGADAVVTKKGADLSTDYADAVVQFYSDGQDYLTLQIDRLTSDTTRTVWVDQAVYRSTFSMDEGGGQAPIGATVTVEAANAVLINISATLTIASGYNAASVRAAVQQNIETYIKSLAFSDDNDVRYVRIGQAILDTTGVTDYGTLTVNGGTANIAIDTQEVAVAGSVSLT
jgi:uncharacterized phage protein gp47/JayE